MKISLKKKKIPGYIIILQKCAKCNYVIIFHFGLLFALLPPLPLTAQKIISVPHLIIINICVTNINYD